MTGLAADWYCCPTPSGTATVPQVLRDEEDQGRGVGGGCAQPVCGAQGLHHVLHQRGAQVGGHVPAYLSPSCSWGPQPSPAWLVLRSLPCIASLAKSSFLPLPPLLSSTHLPACRPTCLAAAPAASAAGATATRQSTAWEPCAATTTFSKPLRGTTQCCCNRWADLRVGGLGRRLLSDAGPVLTSVSDAAACSLAPICPSPPLPPWPPAGGRPAAEGVPRLLPGLPPGRHLELPHETGGGGRWLVLGGGGCSEGGWQGRLAVCPGWLFSTAPPLLH